MPSKTPGLGLYKWTETEPFDVSEVNANTEQIERLLIPSVYTSATRPTTYRYVGRTIYETDTEKYVTWSGSEWGLTNITGTRELGTLNLDTLRQPGIYFQTVAANSTVERGYPADIRADRNSVLEVMTGLAANGDIITFQRLTQSTLRSFTRYAPVNGVWDAWITEYPEKDTGWINTGTTPASGWSGSFRGIILNGMAHIYVSVTRTGPPIVPPANGDVANVDIIQLPAAFKPRPYPGVHNVGLTIAQVGPLATFHLNDLAMVRLGAILPGVTMPTDQSYSMTATYPTETRW